jgi:hypothetical protein
MSNKKEKCVYSIDCRSVGPGGTMVAMYATREGLKCIWSNESCPYESSDVSINEETYEASDKHNVSLIPWSDFDKIIEVRNKFR